MHARRSLLPATPPVEDEGLPPAPVDGLPSPCLRGANWAPAASWPSQGHSLQALPSNAHRLGDCGVANNSISNSGWLLASANTDDDDDSGGDDLGHGDSSGLIGGLTPCGTVHSNSAVAISPITGLLASHGNSRSRKNKYLDVTAAASPTATATAGPRLSPRGSLTGRRHSGTAGSLPPMALVTLSPIAATAAVLPPAWPAVTLTSTSTADADPPRSPREPPPLPPSEAPKLSDELQKRRAIFLSGGDAAISAA